MAAHKLGFIALIGVFLAKFAKLIFIGLAVAGGGVAKFFRRSPKPAPAAQRPAGAVPPAFASTVIDPPAPSLPPLEFDAGKPAPPHDR